MADNAAREKRRRSACWKCKERRVRCGLERPTCRNCARSKHQCQYGQKLMWREDAVARGICFGRQGVYGRATNTPILGHLPASFCYKGDFHFLNTSVANFDDSQQEPAASAIACSRITSDFGHVPIQNISEDEDDDNQNQSHHERALQHHRPEREPTVFTLSPSNSNWFSQFDLVSSGKDPYEAHLFNYYVNSLCPSLSNIPTKNPYMDFITPLSLTSRALFHSVISWAAYELSYKSPNGQTLIDLSVKYKVRALRWLREEVTSSQGDTGAGGLVPILATMITLSSLEIVETCSSAWIVHLRAARTICNILWPRGLDVVDKFQRFCTTWLVSHDIMSRRTWVQETLFKPSEWFVSDDETEIDATIVCSRGLVHQIAEIGALIADMRRGPSSAEETASFLERRDRIETSLHSLKQRISLEDDSATSELRQIAECKRLSALIYLYAGVDGAGPSSPAIQASTATVVQILSKIEPKPSMIFALFVIGTMGVWNEEDRRMVLDKFTGMAKTRPLASIIKAKEAVEAAWLDKDIGKDRRWEHLLEKRGSFLSLA